MSDLAPILQGFFTVKLIQQKDASPHTIASYRDTWRLLLTYAQQATGTEPARMQIGQLDHDLIAGFLRHLETGRGNSGRTRNIRLAAIHSMFRYAQLRAPGDLDTIARVLAIDGARTGTREIDWLTDAEAGAILAACDRATWTGRRDHTMITVLLATGLRISELLSLTRADARIQAVGSHVRCTGKGRKNRSTPLDPAATATLREWLDRSSGAPSDPLFTPRGHPRRHLTRDAVQARLSKYQRTAAETQPSLTGKKVTPHVFRHTRAMRMRRAGHDISVLALWLGHEDISSSSKYLHADMAAKERTLERTMPDEATGRYQPTDAMLAFLDSLTRPSELSRPAVNTSPLITVPRTLVGITRMSAQAMLWRSRHNEAEQVIRMSKLRIKVSGCMRSVKGAETFCAIRSYLATAARHGITWLDALTRAAEGNPWIPGTT
jgi:integrase/recombinase XerD